MKKHDIEQYQLNLARKKKHAQEEIEKFKTDPVIKTNKKQQNNQFYKLGYDIMENENYRKTYASKLALLQELLKRHIKSSKQFDQWQLYNYYYKEQDKLAVVFRLPEIAEWFGVHYQTAVKWIKQLEKEKSIIIEKHPKYGKINVYIIGTKKWNNTTKENDIYYYCVK